jgi:hypothetical protein
MKAIPNKKGKMKNDSIKIGAIKKVSSTIGYRKSQKALWTYFGNYLKNSMIGDLKRR